MNIFRQGPLGILWGGKQECAYAKDVPEFSFFCEELRQKLNLATLVVLDQEHGVIGYDADKAKSGASSVYQHVGDWLITKNDNVGIAVLSADCLPVVLHDPAHGAIGIAHAGWKGSVKAIVHVLLKEMVAKYATDAAQVMVYFGPAAKPCCYEVSSEFAVQVPEKYRSVGLFFERDGKLFFDNRLLCERMLLDQGVMFEHINNVFNVCTMCNEQFYSARRDKHMKRNITVAFFNRDY